MVGAISYGIILVVLGDDERNNCSNYAARVRVYIFYHAVFVHCVWVLALYCCGYHSGYISLVERLQERSQYVKFLHEKKESRSVKIQHII